MSTVNFKQCDNCGAIRSTDDVFCGTCGKPFGTSSTGNSHTTLTSGKLQPDSSTNSTNTSQSFYTPVQPTSPGYPARNSRIYQVIIAALVVMLVVAGFVIGLQVGRGSTPAAASNNNTPVTKATTAAVNNNPTTTLTAIDTAVPGSTPSPSLSVSPEVSPSPAHAVFPGTIICKSDSSTNWAGWQIEGAWKLLNGELLYDGTGNGAQLVAPPNCQPTTPNYAVDVRMKIVSACCHFGIIVRGSASSNGYTGYQVSIYTTTFENLNISTLGGQGSATAGYSFDNNFHDWRAEVKGNIINFVIDGSKVLSLTDNTYLSPGEVSICCTDTMQLDINSFQITAL